MDTMARPFDTATASLQDRAGDRFRDDGTHPVGRQAFDAMARRMDSRDPSFRP